MGIRAFGKRGQGLSDHCMQVPNLDERVHDIHAVMDSAGVERAVLYGVSEGGPMCVKYALEHPERVKGLILVGTTSRWLQSPDYQTGFAAHHLDSVSQAWGSGVLRNVFFPSISQEEMDDQTYIGFENLVSSRKSVKQLLEYMKSVDIRDLLPQLTCSTLVVHFAGDMAIPVRMGRAMAELIPNAEFVELPGIDHADLSVSPVGVQKVRKLVESLA